ncbi:MAG TPA: hypothetical protein VLM37_10215 [Fibrobacteraceae bacterium]|nr:hypothetical protein [Fibrobacteraceae bacterium]
MTLIFSCMAVAWPGSDLSLDGGSEWFASLHGGPGLGPGPFFAPAVFVAVDASEHNPPPRESSTIVVKQAIAVPDLDAQPLLPNVKADLSTRLRSDLNSLGAFQVIGVTGNDSCFAPECLMQMGRSVGASKVLAGAVIQMGDSWQLSLRMVNTANGQIEGLVTEEVKSQVELYPAVSNALQRLTGMSLTKTQSADNSSAFHSAVQNPRATQRHPKCKLPVKNAWSYYAVTVELEAGSLAGGDHHDGLYGKSSGSWPDMTDLGLDVMKDDSRAGDRDAYYDFAINFEFPLPTPYFRLETGIDVQGSGDRPLLGAFSSYVDELDYNQSLALFRLGGRAIVGSRWQPYLRFMGVLGSYNGTLYDNAYDDYDYYGYSSAIFDYINFSGFAYGVQAGAGLRWNLGRFFSLDWDLLATSVKISGLDADLNNVDMPSSVNLRTVTTGFSAVFKFGAQ